MPQFHLRRWADTAGYVTQWGRIKHNGKLTRKGVAPAATGYVPGLYALEHVPADMVHLVEERVFGFVDDKAAPILEKMVVRGAKSLSIEERYWWAIYLNAALLRVPHVVASISKRIEEMQQKILSEPDADFDAAKGSAPERNLLEWAQNHAPSALANSGMETLSKMIGESRPIERLLSFWWTVRDVSNSSRPLMLGDDPLERIGDLYRPKCLINLPISPGHAFFATNARSIAENIAKMPDRRVVDATNISTISTAKKFVYGDAEPSFVDRYLTRTESSSHLV
ncbi:DUF4238 domain-containing protein [Mesorhizobium sp. M1163]|uniref:DUF4238 domain-containing protein n=1 Tax=Mesorhizobium sp. M1163 TaxID=2957065 RepID=UPI003334BD0F